MITWQIKKLKKGKNTFDKAGRNNKGVITVRHRGGRNKKNYRFIDFKRNFGVLQLENHSVNTTKVSSFKQESEGLFQRELVESSSFEGLVIGLEYDPNRTAQIALILYEKGIISYILAPKGLKIGDKIQTNCVEVTPISKGNACPIGKMPLGTLVHNVELKPGKGGQILRAAGTYGKILKKEKSYVLIRLNSGKLYNIPSLCMASIGIVSTRFSSEQGFDFSDQDLNLGSSNNASITKKPVLKKAGNNRWKGRRPTVRGVAMNPVDHPHGGGEGRSKGGRHPVSPWGKLTKGKPTSFLRKTTNRKLKKKKKIN